MVLIRWHLACSRVVLGWATLPSEVLWRHLWGTAVLGGIGFTMALLVTLLALGEQSAGEAVAKLAIMLASLVSGTVGYLLLRALPGLVAVAESYYYQPEEIGFG